MPAVGSDPATGGPVRWNSVSPSTRGPTPPRQSYFSTKSPTISCDGVQSKEVFTWWLQTDQSGSDADNCITIEMWFCFENDRKPSKTTSTPIESKNVIKSFVKHRELQSFKSNAFKIQLNQIDSDASPSHCDSQRT